MHTTTVARQFLQECLNSVRDAERRQDVSMREHLDIHARLIVCADLAEERRLISIKELEEWRRCAASAGSLVKESSPLERLLDAPGLVIGNRRVC